LGLMASVNSVDVNRDVLIYIVKIIEATRNHPDIKLGSSPRGSLSLMHLAKSYALLNNRDYVTPSDVKTVADPSLNHRIILNASSMVKGIKAQEVIKEIVDKVPVPVEA